MHEHSIKVMMAAPLFQEALVLIEKRDISMGQLVRDLVAREIHRSRNAKPPVRADERLIAPLRAQLAGDLAYAQTWDELDHRLRDRGFTLQPAGGGLALHSHPDNRRICKASELGFSYSKLMRRIGSPFPNHPHHWLAERMLDQPAEDDDFTVIERF